MRQIILFVVLLVATNFSQSVNKVLISGIEGYEQHDADIKSAFEAGYSSFNNSQFSGIIEIYPHNISESFEYAKTNNYEMIIRSTTGLTT
ncbi:MAG: hypothetical protein DRJ01_14360, partial [Bacteroidetes bacterium]